MYYDIQYVRANSNWNPVTGLWLIGSILLVVNFAVGLIYLLRRRGQMGHDRFTALLQAKIGDKDQTHDDSPDPVTDLKQQYAQGDLDEEEFDQRLEKQLESGNTVEQHDSKNSP